MGRTVSAEATQCPTCGDTITHLPDDGYWVHDSGTGDHLAHPPTNSDPIEIEWMPIPGWEGHYEVSGDGQVRSLDRQDRLGRPLRGRILRPVINKYGYPMLGLKRDTGRVLVTAHKVVMLAFKGPRPDGQVVRHLDGNPANNLVSNLVYGTQSENHLDSVRHGTHVCAAKTHCKRGHEFTPDNTYIKGNGSRECRRCVAIRRQRYRGAAA
jgi:hypothetical protein